MTKKVYIIILVSFLCFLPSISNSMIKISDDELNKVYGTAGVNIVIDDFQSYTKFGVLSFIDIDGGNNDFKPPNLSIIENSMGAKISLKNLKYDVLRVNQLIMGDSAGYLNPFFDISMSEVMDSFEPSVFTIDVVDEIPILSIGYNYMLSAKNSILHLPDPDGETYNKNGIVFSLPTIDFYIDEINIESITMESLFRESYNNGESFFPINIKGMDLTILGGLAEVTSHQYCGIDIAIDDMIVYANFSKISLIDPEGSKKNNFSDGNISLTFNNVSIDVAQINALTHTNISNILNILNPKIQSPGKYNAHLDNLDNYDLIVLSDVLKSFHGQPLLINVSRQLGGTTDLYKSAGVQGSIGGVFIALPTVEIYINNFKIEKTTIDDPSNKIMNNGASFFGIHDKGVELAILNGYLEISTH